MGPGVADLRSEPPFSVLGESALQNGPKRFAELSVAALGPLFMQADQSAGNSPAIRPLSRTSLWLSVVRCPRAATLVEVAWSNSFLREASFPDERVEVPHHALKDFFCAQVWSVFHLMKNRVCDLLEVFDNHRLRFRLAKLLSRSQQKCTMRRLVVQIGNSGMDGYQETMGPW